MIATIELVGNDNEQDAYHIEQIIDQVEVMCQNRRIGYDIGVTAWSFGTQHVLYNDVWQPGEKT